MGCPVAKKPQVGDHITIAKFANVVPMFLSLVSKPASKQMWTQRSELDRDGLLEMERGVILAGRSDNLEVANAIVSIRNAQAPEGAKRAYRIAFPIVRTEKAQRIVYGMAYCPPLDSAASGEITLAEYEKCVDTWGSYMDSPTLHALAHAYMEQSRAIDVQHSFEAVGAVPVESWITHEATKEFPDVGAWVCGVKINDDAVWARVESGELASFSIAVLCSFEPVEVRIASREVRSMDEDYGFDGVNVRKCLPFKDLPLAEKDTAWAAGEAKKRVAAYASEDGSGAKDKMDWAQYELAFLFVDDEKKSEFGGYKLPIADVIDDDLKCVPKAIYAAAGRLDQSDLSDEEKGTCRATLEKYYKKMGETAPWAQSAEGGRPAGEPAQRSEQDPVVPPVAPPAEPAARTEQTPPAPIKREAGEFTNALNQHLSMMEPQRRIDTAMYLFQDMCWHYFYECFYNNRCTPEESKAEVQMAGGEMVAFILAQFDAYAQAAQTRSGTPEEQKDKLLAFRAELAKRVGKKIAKARLDKIEGAAAAFTDGGTLLAEVIAEAKDIVVEESAEEDDAMKTQLAEIVQRMTTLEEKVAALPTAEAVRAPAIERAEALTTKVASLEADLAKARKDLDALLEDAPEGTVVQRGGNVDEPQAGEGTVEWRGVRMRTSLLAGRKS